jgi:hypothetical protein
MNREALVQTVRVLEEVKKQQLAFDLRNFVGYRDEEADEQVAISRLSVVGEQFQQDYLKEVSLLVPHKCGANACATGYAGLDKWFRERGWFTEFDGGVNYYVEGERAIPGWDGMRAFYDLTEAQAQYLFIDDYYKKPDDVGEVIARIRDVLSFGFPTDHPCFCDD